MSHTKSISREHLKFQEYYSKGMLRFMTCGSVDDGKSTLIGRLLYESEQLCIDQLDTIKLEQSLDSNNSKNIDFSLLLDGLSSEQEQGITIDIAYRYFSTLKRRFVIADAPGHEQYIP